VIVGIRGEGILKLVPVSLGLTAASIAGRVRTQEKIALDKNNCY